MAESATLAPNEWVIVLIRIPLFINCFNTPAKRLPASLAYISARKKFIETVIAVFDKPKVRLIFPLNFEYQKTPKKNNRTFRLICDPDFFQGHFIGVIAVNVDAAVIRLSCD